jgi:DNA-binding transcriptional LysR family regulator
MLSDEVLALCRRVGNFSPQVVNEPDRTSTVLLLVESGIGVSILPGWNRHLVRAGGLVLFCRLQPAFPFELRLSWLRGAASSPTVEAFRELLQSQRETIRAVMEARPSEKKQREGRRP